MKKFLLTLVVLVVVAAAGISFYLDTIVKSTAEQIASDTLQTEVTISSVNVSLFSQNVSISGVAIKNPAGFESENILEVGSFTAQAEDLFGSPVMISSVVVDGLTAYAEMSDGKLNFQELKRNMASTAVASSSGSSNSDASDSPSSSESAGLAIRELIISNAMAVAAVSLAGEGQSQDIALPTIRMTDIGTENQAIQPPEAVRRVVAELTQAVTQATTGSFLDRAKEQIQESIGSTLEGLF